MPRNIVVGVTFAVVHYLLRFYRLTGSAVRLLFLNLDGEDFPIEI